MVNSSSIPLLVLVIVSHLVSSTRNRRQPMYTFSITWCEGRYNLCFRHYMAINILKQKSVTFFNFVKFLHSHPNRNFAYLYYYYFCIGTKQSNWLILIFSENIRCIKRVNTYNILNFILCLHLTTLLAQSEYKCLVHHIYRLQ